MELLFHDSRRESAQELFVFNLSLGQHAIANYLPLEMIGLRVDGSKPEVKGHDEIGIEFRVQGKNLHGAMEFAALFATVQASHSSFQEFLYGGVGVNIRPESRGAARRQEAKYEKRMGALVKMDLNAHAAPV